MNVAVGPGGRARGSFAPGTRGALLAATALILWLPGRLCAQETSLTIYSDGRVLVRRTLSVPVPRGVSSFAADLGARAADPTSFLALDEGAQVRGVRSVGASGQDGSLRRAVGTDLDFRVTGADSVARYVRGTLLSMDPPAVRLDGRVMYGFPGIPVFPDSLAQLEPRYELTVEAQRPMSAFRLAFLSDGLSWHASYSLVLPSRGAGTGSVTGTATIVNGGALTVRGAQVQLLAGEVRRAAAPNRPMPMMALARAAPAVAAEAGPAEESVGETHVYTLPGQLDIGLGETRSVALFARAETPVEPEFVLRPQGWGALVRWPDTQREIHPAVSYLVRRPAASAFGAQPLPAGTVRVFSPDSAGRLQLVGEAAIGHTPAGRELHLATGTVFDVTAERTQTAFDNTVRRQIVASYRVVLRNAKDTAVTVQVLDEFPNTWEMLSSTAVPERLSSSSVRFPVVVPANAEATLEYRVRVRW
jgi:hypothetical protein